MATPAGVRASSPGMSRAYDATDDHSKKRAPRHAGQFLVSRGPGRNRPGPIRTGSVRPGPPTPPRGPGLLGLRAPLAVIAPRLGRAGSPPGRCVRLLLFSEGTPAGRPSIRFLSGLTGRGARLLELIHADRPGRRSASGRPRFLGAGP